MQKQNNSHSQKVHVHFLRRLIILVTMMYDLQISWNFPAYSIPKTTPTFYVVREKSQRMLERLGHTCFLLNY